MQTADWQTGVIEAIQLVYQSQTMYNFTVATAHTYFVGKGQWLVHNDCNFINPSVVRYSQDSVSQNFKDGSSVFELAEGLHNGSISPNSIPPIRIFERDGQLFTLDNRRLVAFELAGVDIPYVMATPEEIANEMWKFTTTNEGATIRIRGVVGGE